MPISSIPNLAKHVPSLTSEQQEVLSRLSLLDLHTFNESDVREEFLVPLIGLLGYQKTSDYTVLREQSYPLNPLFLTVGSSRIKLDYQFNIYKAGFWLLEAKAAQCKNPSQPPTISNDAIAQAHFYTHHREIDCPLFGVSNGWWTHLYDRDSETPHDPILSIFHTDLPNKFVDLYNLIGSSQVTFWIKRKLLTRIEQVLGADVDLTRTDEFMREVTRAAARAKPRVLENFRRNAKVQSEEHSNEFRDYIENTRPAETLDNLLIWPLTIGRMNLACSILAKKLARFPGSNQSLFFHKLLVREPRAVTIDYYFNALNLLGALCHQSEIKLVDIRGNGHTDTPLIDVYIEFTHLLLTHFSSRPDLQVIWAMEGLLKRMAKRALISSQKARLEISAGVQFQRYLLPEEKIAYLGPSPARTIVQTVESISYAELGAFVSRHTEKSKNGAFDTAAAIEDFKGKQQRIEALENSTNEAYMEIVSGLGDEWSELTWSDHLNRTWDRLGHGVCEIILSRPELLQQLPDDCRRQIVELSRLGNSFARQCIEKLGMDVPSDYPDARERLNALFTLKHPKHVD